jgi:hypothetical protein
MPVPLNAFVDIVKVWFTEKLDYLANDSVPVKPSREGAKATTPSDIDLICKYPKEKCRSVVFESRRTVKLCPNLLVECKGWFDYSKPEFAKHLHANLNLLDKYGGNFLPQSLPRKLRDHFFFFREEVFKKGVEIFGSKKFQRVIIGPFLVQAKGDSRLLKDLITQYDKRGIVVIQMRDILVDLFDFIHKAKERKRKGDSGDADKLRKTYALELLHLVDTYMEINTKEEKWFD